LHERYHTARVWWRGGQDEVWGNQFVLREQNRYYWRIWEWWRDLQYRVVKCNQLAVKAAHARGMELWMAYGLFDNGSGPDVGFTGFPYAAEDKIRVEHPEWAPVNKYGTWHQGGPIEFCYEGARRAMVEYLTKYRQRTGLEELRYDFARRGDNGHFHVERFEFQRRSLEIQAPEMRVAGQKNSAA